MKKLAVILLVVALALGLALPAGAHTELNQAEVTLFAGQDIDVGTVSVWNDGTTLYVTYQTNGDWVITETHLAVATSLASIPQTKKGNPIPGHFDWKMTHDPAVPEYIYVINLSDAGFDVGVLLYIAAHAEVQNDIQEETAWADGPGFDGKNWATYFNYNVQLHMEVDTTLDGTAEWITSEDCCNAFCVHLATGDFESQATADEGRIVVYLPDGTTLGDIESISWSVRTTEGYPPHVDIYLDPADVNTNEQVLTAEISYNNDEGLEWDEDLSDYIGYDDCLSTFELTSDDGYGEINDSTMLWLTKLGSGDDNAPSSTLGHWKTSTVDSDPEGDLGSPPYTTIDSDTGVLILEIEIDNWIATSEAYVNNIIVTFTNS